MLRYEGLLRPLPRPAPWPARWIAVATEGETVPVEERPRLRQTGLRRWHALAVEMRGAEFLGGQHVEGADAGALWQWLGAIAGQAGPTWVISPRALLDWTLLGLWERLLLGQLVIAPSGPARPRGRGDRGLVRPPGQCMTGDPPSAALIQLGTEGRKIQWVCAGNYGWRDFLLDVPPAAQPALLMAHVTAASAALCRHQLGGFAPTVGAMALKAWRSQHLKESLYVSDGERERSLLARASSGGRLWTLPGHAHGDRAYWVDGRGLYGYLAHAHPLPVGCRYYHHRGRAPAESGGADVAGFLAHVRLREGGRCYPSRRNGLTVYPEGPCELTLCGPELQHAIDRGLVSEIGECYEYSMGNPLQSFQAACYALRQEGEAARLPAVAALGKALAVTLVGKLAAWEELWEEVIPDYNDPICGTWFAADERGRTVEYRATAGTVARKRRVGRASYAIPAIPLWVWSYGRVWLLDRMLCAGMSECLYADTDGLVVTERGYDRLETAGLIRNNEWGQLRLVAGPVEVEILGPKMIRIGDEIIQAGAPKAQRSGDFADEGYWYRRPWNGGAGAYGEGIWEEEFRENQTNGGENGA